jgi:hypothetical protein
MTIDDRQLEKASLLPDRWYIILNKLDDETFSISAYDTTEEDDSQYFEAGTIVLNGIMELIDSDFERVTAAGMARLAQEHVRESLAEATNNPEISREEGSNVIKIDFGTKQ